MALPCQHQQSVTSQVRPTIDLLTHMDEWHPDILLQHAIQPQDYKSGLVFRSAIESIRGTFIASSTTRREQLVSTILQALKQQQKIADYDQTGRSNRYDFTIALQRNPDYFACRAAKVTASTSQSARCGLENSPFGATSTEPSSISPPMEPIPSSTG